MVYTLFSRYGQLTRQLRLEENFWLEEMSGGNFSCRRIVAEKNVVIVTTIENAISLYDTLRKTKTLY